MLRVTAHQQETYGQRVPALAGWWAPWPCVMCPSLEDAHMHTELSPDPVLTSQSRKGNKGDVWPEHETQGGTNDKYGAMTGESSLPSIT